MPFSVQMANSGKQLPKCRYGSQCYRTNADHRMEYWHPECRSDTRTSIVEEHTTPDAGPKDGGRITISFQPNPLSASSSNVTHVLDAKIDGAPEGERGRNALEGMKRGEISEFGPNVATTRDAPSGIPYSVGQADAGVLLLLIGVPGSGKSTFCSKLMSNAAQPWTRICQDIIAKGKRGTKKECLKHAERALVQKVSVVIDRCNIDKVQRLEFLQLAASFGVEAHGVVLNLPASLCIQRASKRIGHEGGVSAGNAGSVINRLAKSRQLPILSEGFSRITFCKTDMDIEKVVQQYRELLPSEHLESGVFGGDLNKCKNALDLVVEKRSDQRNRGNSIEDKDHYEERARQGSQQAQIVGGRRRPELMLEVRSSCQSEAGNCRDLASSVGIEDKGTRTLAFPSISTADFQFDHERASSVLVDAVAKFLSSEDSKMRLVLVDLKHSQMLSLVSRKARERGLDASRFLTFVGDITKLRTSRGPDCNIIANAANWRLKAGGGGVNAAIFSAAGPDLERATKMVAQTINPGTSLVVQLPESSPFFIREGVTHVIHVLGPNMNPQRPNCLAGDYHEGCRILQSSYASLFQNFSSIVKSYGVGESSSDVEFSRTVHNSSEEVNGKTIVDFRSTHEKPAKNAFTVLMQASKRNRELKDVNPKRDKVRVTEEVLARAGRGTDEAVPQLELDTSQSYGPENVSLNNKPQSNLGGTSIGTCPRGVGQKEETDTKNPEGGTGAEVNEQGRTTSAKRWDDEALALDQIAIHPEQYTQVLQITDDAMVLLDIHPKAKKHLLVVARKLALDSFDNLQEDHLPLLRHMHSLGEEWAAHYLKADSSLSFRLGYHLVPSMRQVHFHLISQDFESTSLKSKRHWNSFTTSFFRDSVDLLNQLERHGRTQNSVKDAELLLDLELRCHRCHSAHPNLFRLQQHISNCRRPVANSSFLITSQSLAFMIG